jgi:SAM-dependent methyltransferase
MLDKSIDAVVCSFGYMFMQNKRKAFSEAFRVLRSGGMLIFTTWDRLEYNPIQHSFRKVLSDYFKEALDEKNNRAFSFNDEVEIGNLLLDVGFSLMSIEKVEKKVTLSNAREVAIGMAYGSCFYDDIVRRSPQLLNEIIEVTENRISTILGETPLDAPLKALICMARKFDFVGPCFSD